MKKLVRSYFAHYILPKTVTSVETPTKSELPLKIIFMDQMQYLGSDSFLFWNVKKHK